MGRVEGQSNPDAFGVAQMSLIGPGPRHPADREPHEQATEGKNCGLQVTASAHSSSRAVARRVAILREAEARSRNWTVGAAGRENRARERTFVLMRLIAISGVRIRRTTQYVVGSFLTTA